MIVSVASDMMGACSERVGPGVYKLSPVVAPVAHTERLQGGEKFRVNHPEIYGGSYSESGVQLLLSQARRWRKPIDFVGDISRTFQSNFAGHHHIARRPERVNTCY